MRKYTCKIYDNVKERAAWWDSGNVNLLLLITVLCKGQCQHRTICSRSHSINQTAFKDIFTKLSNTLTYVSTDSKYIATKVSAKNVSKSWATTKYYLCERMSKCLCPNAFVLKCCIRANYRLYLSHWALKYLNPTDTFTLWLRSALFVGND